MSNDLRRAIEIEIYKAAHWKIYEEAMYSGGDPNKFVILEGICFNLGVSIGAKTIIRYAQNSVEWNWLNRGV